MSLVHPRKLTERSQFYPFTVTFKGSPTGGSWSAVTGLSALSCAYVPAATGPGGTFEDEGAALDRLLLPGYYPTIENDMQAVVTMPTLTKYFAVADVQHIAQGTETLVIVTPQQ